MSETFKPMEYDVNVQIADVFFVNQVAMAVTTDGEVFIIGGKGPAKTTGEELIDTCDEIYWEPFNTGIMKKQNL